MVGNGKIGNSWGGRSEDLHESCGGFSRARLADCHFLQTFRGFSEKFPKLFQIAVHLFREFAITKEGT